LLRSSNGIKEYIALLLILAGISISSLTNSGLFENAKLTTRRTSLKW